MSVKPLRIPRTLFACAAYVAVAALVLLWVFGTTDRIRTEARDRFFEQYNRQQLLLAQQASRTIEGTFATFRRNLTLVASLFEESGVTRARAQRVTGSLERVYDVLSDLPIIDLVVFDREGTVVAIVPADAYTLGRNYAWRGYYRWARDRGRPGEMYLSPFMRMEGGQHRGDKALIVAEGIYGPGGGFQGVVIFTINFDELARKHILSVRIGEHGYAWLVDANNRTVLVDPRGKIGGQSFDEAFSGRWPKLYDMLVRASQERRPALDWYDFEDPAAPSRTVRKLVAYVPVQIQDRAWILGVCTPEREVEALLASFFRRQERFSAVVTAAILLGTALLSGLLLAWNRSLSRQVDLRTRDLAEARSNLEAAFEEVLAAKKAAAVGNLALGMVHEIRNPLSSIRMNIQMIRKRIGPEGDLRENFAIVEEEILRLNGLLQEILSFARPRELRLRRVDLGQIVERVLLLCDQRFRQEGIRLDAGPSEGLPPVRCDPEQIRQVVLNLVLNAVEAMSSAPGDRVLRVALENGGDSLVLRVADTGPGIRAPDLEHVFDPFFTTKAQGGGLGLAISERIVLRHGGAIAVESGPGGGAVFTVSLPVEGPEDGAEGVEA